MITSNLKWTGCYHTLCVKTVRKDLRADSRSDDGKEVRKLGSEVLFFPWLHRKLKARSSDPMCELNFSTSRKLRIRFEDWIVLGV